MSTFCSLGRLRRRLSVLVLLTLAGCASPTVHIPPKPTPTPSPVSTPSLRGTPVPFPAPLTGLLGPTPTHCPAGPPLGTLSSDVGGFVGGGEVGRSPVWTVGLTPGQSLALPVTPFTYPGTKIMWIVGPSYHQPVTLSGYELSTGAPVWFDLSGRTDGDRPVNPMTRAVLDPSNPNRGWSKNATGTWNIWGILMYFFSAGCYQIDTAWASGSWQMVVAVGS